jgi:hypothetical protein
VVVLRGGSVMWSKVKAGDIGVFFTFWHQGIGNIVAFPVVFASYGA